MRVNFEKQLIGVSEISVEEESNLWTELKGSIFIERSREDCIVFTTATNIYRFYMRKKVEPYKSYSILKNYTETKMMVYNNSDEEQLEIAEITKTIYKE